MMAVQSYSPPTSDLERRCFGGTFCSSRAARLLPLLPFSPFPALPFVIASAVPYSAAGLALSLLCALLMLTRCCVFVVLLLLCGLGGSSTGEAVLADGCVAAWYGEGAGGGRPSAATGSAATLWLGVNGGEVW